MGSNLETEAGVPATLKWLQNIQKNTLSGHLDTA